MSSSPPVQQQQQIIQTVGVEDLRSTASPNARQSYPIENSPRPELTPMTNVNVLDLQMNSQASTSIQQSSTRDSDDETKKNPRADNYDENESISCFSQPQQFMPKLDFTDEQILRLIGATGDQQIISREYINGEHHILTRNENGEHIITRIVTQTTNEDPAQEPSSQHNEPPAESPEKLITPEIEHSQNDATIVYTSSANPIATSVLQYTDTSNKLATSVPVNASSGNVLISAANASGIDDSIDESKGKGHIIYTHGDKTYVETVKDNHIYENGKVPIYATATDDAKQQPLDLIYEEGGKTVIYTTSADPKSLELYAGNELNLLDGPHQVIVQGPNVYVVAAQPTLDAEIATVSQQNHSQR